MLREVVRLLEAGLGEPLILRWLEDNGKTPGLPTADDLVALKRAGASDPLVAALLDRAQAAAPGPGAPPAVTNPSAPAAPAAAPTPDASAPTPAGGGAPRPSERPLAAPSLTPEPLPAAAAPASVPLDVALRYIHVADEAEPWDLVVYLDGVPFEPVQAAPSEASAATWTSQRQVAPGPHVLRWAQELHPERQAGSGPHAARFDPARLGFELAPGTAGAIEVEYRDRAGLVLRFGGPMTVRVTQGGREIAEKHDSSGDPPNWPELCEEIEANLGGNPPGFADRQRLRHCVRWAELWSGVPAVPRRDEVRPPIR